MTTLEARARSAAHAINAGIAEFTPAASFDVVAVRHQRRRTLQAGLAGAAVAVLVVLAGIAIRPAPTPQVAEPSITTPVAPTAPLQPDIVVPVAPTTTQAPATTTTTEAAEPTTSTVPADTTPPPLAITSPNDGEHFEVDTIEFRGTTEPGAAVFAGRYEATVDGGGNWSIVLILSPGANGAKFVATDAAGNETEARVTVFYDPPQPTTTTSTTTTTKAPKEEIEFTAFNVHGVSEQSPPFDVYWGTAPPGTPIYVESEYGNGSITANENGDWEVRVYFPEAPAGKEFTVKVKDDKGQKFLFGFKYLV